MALAVVLCHQLRVVQQRVSVRVEAGGDEGSVTVHQSQFFRRHLEVDEWGADTALGGEDHSVSGDHTDARAAFGDGLHGVF